MSRKEIIYLHHIVDSYEHNNIERMDPDAIIPFIKSALDIIMEQEKKIEELEERIAIMSEDQYKSSEIRFP